MRKKLRSQQGIAMIFAIVGVVVVMVIGVVFLTAGYANYSKLFGRKNDRQTYYTLVSAAKYAGSQLHGAKIRITEIWDADWKTDSKTAEEDYKINNNKTKEYEPEFDGDDWTKALVEKLYNKEDVYYQLEFDNDSGFKETVDVTVSDFDISSSWFQMLVSMSETDKSGKMVTNSVTVEFTIGPSYWQTTPELVDKFTGTESSEEDPSEEEKEDNPDGKMDSLRKTVVTTYTIDMGNIGTVKGGSGT